MAFDKNKFPSSKIRMAIFLGAALCLFLGMSASAALEDGYLRNPSFRLPTTDRAVPYEMKGITVFLTQQDASILHGLGWFEAVLGVAIAMMLFIWPDLRRKKDAEEKARLWRAVRDASIGLKAIQILYIAVVVGLGLSVIIKGLMHISGH